MKFNSLEAKKFQKNMEDFVCEHCERPVKGDGFTNHCPSCLWSKHVDVNPGDRSDSCLGLMRPNFIDKTNGRDFLVHICEKCGRVRRNKVAKNDSFEALYKFAQDRSMKSN